MTDDILVPMGHGGLALQLEPFHFELAHDFPGEYVTMISQRHFACLFTGPQWGFLEGDSQCTTNTYQLR